MGGREVDFGTADESEEAEASEGLTERQQQEKLTRDNNRGGKGRGGKAAAPKAAPASSTKKEAFAAEAKKAAGRKKTEVPFEAAVAGEEAGAEATDESKAKKARAKKSA